LYIYDVLLICSCLQLYTLFCFVESSQKVYLVFPLLLNFYLTATCFKFALSSMRSLCVYFLFWAEHVFISPCLCVSNFYVCTCIWRATSFDLSATQTLFDLSCLDDHMTLSREHRVTNTVHFNLCLYVIISPPHERQKFKMQKHNSSYFFRKCSFSNNFSSPRMFIFLEHFPFKTFIFMELFLPQCFFPKAFWPHSVHLTSQR
jgi:hypothetical protein